MVDANRWLYGVILAQPQLIIFLQSLRSGSRPDPSARQKPVGQLQQKHSDPMRVNYPTFPAKRLFFRNYLSRAWGTKFSSKGMSAWIAADIIRFEDGKLAEHWDVLQD
jgi:hypothetical protein